MSVTVVGETTPVTLSSTSIAIGVGAGTIGAGAAGAGTAGAGVLHGAGALAGAGEAIPTTAGAGEAITAIHTTVIHTAEDITGLITEADAVFTTEIPLQLTALEVVLI